MKIGKILLDLDGVSWVFISDCGNYRSQWFFVRVNSDNALFIADEILQDSERINWAKRSLEHVDTYHQDYADITQLLITRYGLETDSPMIA